MSKYDFGLDLDSDNSVSIMIDMIQCQSKILEFGPANGRMTRYLKEKMECEVDIVEIDEEAGLEASKYSNRSFLGEKSGDIEKFKWLEELKDEKYDYIVFADVLEHLHKPKEVLRKCKNVLKDDGSIVISVPNIAHNSVIIDLINDEFKYNEIGLLDNTHISFFTYKSLVRMIEECGYKAVIENGTYCKVGENEIVNSYTCVSKEVGKKLREREQANLYQFVFELKKKENATMVSTIKPIKLDNKYEVVCYVKENEDDAYTENKALRKIINFNKNIVQFDLREFDNIQQLRIDPMDTNCIIHIKKIYTIINDENIALNILNTNGIHLDNGVFVFSTDDPQIYINTYELSVKNLFFECEYIDYDSDSIGGYEAVIKEVIDKKESVIQEKENVIQEKENVIQEKENVIQEKENVIQEKENVIQEKESVIQEKEKYIENINDELEAYKLKYNEVFNQKNYLNNRISNVESMYNEIINSTCWKITKPIRIVLDLIKGFLKSNRYMNLFYKTLVHIKNYGIKQTLNKIKYKLKIRKVGKKVKSHINQLEHNNININELVPLKTFGKKIAVHVHLYYIDLLDEFIQYLNNIPYTFDLFVSCKDDTDINTITNKLKKITNVNNVNVEVTINRGRDIAPLYVQFGEKIQKYDYFLHIHTKKSLYSGTERYGWRQYSLDSLLASENTVKSIFSLFESDKNIGLFCPEVYDDVPALGLTWLSNEEKGRQILGKMDIPFEKCVFTYPVGSFFWAKTEAVKDLFEYDFKYDDFQPESGQTDGTTAHALERVIAFVCKNKGYNIAIHENKSGTIKLGKTLKPFDEYFSLDLYAVRYYLCGYDLISFDIFDTLITRCVYQPDDLFHLMRRKISKKYNIDMDFLKLRKKAEAIAWEKKHEKCSINDIYDELSHVAKISKQMAMELKQMEIDTEISVCIPRKDMLNIFNHIKENGKKIVLISDMYLTSDIIEKILLNCGYEGYDDLWVSCEKGGRKDNDTIWDSFFEEYGQYRSIHVGDNETSDVQIIGNRGKDTFYIFNPIMAFKMSKNYSKFIKYMDTTIENSIMLGMLINGGLYNSPFCLQVGTGEPFVNQDEEMGHIAFGAIFATFAKWIDNSSETDSTLLFLAREGYLLEQIYNKFCAASNKEAQNSIYFLSSRRATTVAGISSEEDVRNIINQYYKGGLKNLLKARLGLDLYEEMKECEINMPSDESKVMNMLKPHMNEIIQKATKEANAYLKYIDNMLSKNSNNKVSVVDVGYSGTIQYYLSKLLNEKISGYYICTSNNKKPEQIGCKCSAMYELDNIEQMHNSKLFKCQLFLEAALQAPYGQLLCFEEKNGDIIPKFNNDEEVPIEIMHLQKGIVKYCGKYFDILKDLSEEIDLDKDLAEDILYEILFNSDFSEDISRAFNVQDDYCSNGSQKFDIKKKAWDVNYNNI